MKFCIECFIDLEIRNIIGQSHDIGDCPICNKESVSLYDPEKDFSIKDAFNKLNTPVNIGICFKEFSDFFKALF